MAYTAKLQTEEKYRNMKYGQHGMIYQFGDGPAALCNALANAGIADVSIEKMCAYSASVGARIPYSTDEDILLQAASELYGFTFRSTQRRAQTLSHLRAGGVAICVCGTRYKMFNIGQFKHFIAAVGIEADESVIVADSYWCEEDPRTWLEQYRYHNTDGLLKCNFDDLFRATQGYRPRFYLISERKSTQKIPRIAIDAGHGRYANGIRCLESIDPNETREWVLNADIATRVCDLLKLYNCQTQRMDDITGETDVHPMTRLKKANDWDADCFISIHNNAGLHGKEGGGPIAFSLNETGEDAKLRNELLFEIADAVNMTADSNDILMDRAQTARYCVLSRTKMPAAVIKCEFVDSADRTPLLLTAAYRGKLAQGIVNGLVKYLGLIGVKTIERDQHHFM